LKDSIRIPQSATAAFPTNILIKILEECHSHLISKFYKIPISGGLSGLFVIQKGKRQPGLFSFKLQAEKYGPEPEKIGLMQPYIF
jgi:hypothetical protein